MLLSDPPEDLPVSIWPDKYVNQQNVMQIIRRLLHNKMFTSQTSYYLEAEQMLLAFSQTAKMRSETDEELSDTYTFIHLLIEIC